MLHSLKSLGTTLYSHPPKPRPRERVTNSCHRPAVHRSKSTEPLRKQRPPFGGFALTADLKHKIPRTLLRALPAPGGTRHFPNAEFSALKLLQTPTSALPLRSGAASPRPPPARTAAVPPFRSPGAPARRRAPRGDSKKGRAGSPPARCPARPTPGLDDSALMKC